MKKALTYDGRVFLSLSALTLLMFYYVVYNLGGLFFQHDAYYYLAIAENLFNSGEMLDGSSTPAKPVISPQNGIVFIMVLLKYLGITSNINVLYIIGVVNYVCFVWFVFLIYKIYQMFGIDKHTSFVFAASVLLSLYYGRIYVQSINDPIFITLSTFVLYLLLQRKEGAKTFVLLFLCAFVLASFRLSGVLIFFAAATAYAYVKNIKLALLFLAFACVSYLVQGWLADHFILHQEGIDALKQKTFDAYDFSFFLKNILHTLEVNIPESVFAYEKMYTDLEIRSRLVVWLISGSVLTGLFFFMKKGLVTKDYRVALLATYIVAYLCFLQLFFVLVTRYILVIAPFFVMLLLLMLPKSYRVYAASSLLIVSLSITLLVPPNDKRTQEGVSKRHFHERMQDILRGKDYDSITSGSRVTYLLLGQPSLSRVSEVTKKNVLVVGPQRWSGVIIEQLKQVKNMPIQVYQMESYIMYNGTPIYAYWVEFRQNEVDI